MPKYTALRSQKADGFRFWPLLVFLLPWAATAGSITREVWTGISGSGVSQLTSDPRFPNQPSTTETITAAFEAPTDVLDNYGQRMHGYIIPPVTGNYVFWIASDDGGELRLSVDENPANQRRIASVAAWTSSREWGKEPGQQSAPIRLEANRPYYIAALQKEGGGGDNLAVRWLRPDNVDEGPIPGAYLLPWGTAFTAPQIVQQPQNATANEGQTVSFVVQASPTTPAAVRWLRDGVELSGATDSTLLFGPVRITDHNAKFRAVLQNPLGIATSDEATLTVLPDLTPPTVTEVINLGATTLRVTFSEPVDPVTATALSSYQLTGGVTVTRAVVGADPTVVVLTVTPMTLGTPVTLTLSNVRDLAANPNVVPSGSIRNFTPYEYIPWEVGGGTGGNTANIPGGYELTSRSNDIGGANDQFHFGYQERTGDFDIQVRVEKVRVSHPYVHAGLMARESLQANAAFAGVFSGSATLGCFFEARASAAGQSQTAAPTGGFPVNYPHTWLRLQRVGNVFTGYGSFDGLAWQPLGTATVTLPAKLFFGMALASQSSGFPASARFKDLGPVSNPTTFTHIAKSEPVGPSSRRTGLIFSEIMYHPAARADGRDLEFIELYNAESIFLDLTGWRLTGSVDYTFPDGFLLPAGEFVVVAADPASVEAVYGITGVLGPFKGRLNNGGDTLRLRNAADALRLEVAYSPNAPWPAAADGSGHSLVLARPSYGEDDPRAWAASEARGGSPGDVNALRPTPLTSVKINEYLANTDNALLDFVELHNGSNVEVDVSGCVLTDDVSTNKFRIPAGTVIPARGFLAFDENQMGFALDSTGETVYLISPDLGRVLDVVRFGGQESGVSSGRSPDGSETVRRLAQPTRGGANSAWRIEDVVINEIMYHPISKDDADTYIELHNRSAANISLAGWRFTGGIDFQFPAGAQIPPGGFLVVAKDLQRLRANYSQLTDANSLGNFGGSLGRFRDRVVLTKPDTALGSTHHIAVSEVAYVDGGRWPELADGGGSSLELVDPRADALRASNWAASDESKKAGWTQAEFTGPADNGNADHAGNRVQLLMLGPGKCLVDDVEVVRGGTNMLRNGDFETGITGWTLFGHHRASAIVSEGAFAGQQALRLSAPGDGDTANNSVRGNLAASISSGQTITLRAKVRWLEGWPEMLVRVRGGWVEMPVRMDVPKNLGTPGLPNSRRVNNAGPAIFDVAHAPVLPRANEAVVVTCRVSDPDGIVAPQVRFRVDPSATSASLTMRDDGSGGDAIAGDGIYSATLSGRGANTLVAFSILASDDAAAAASSIFPSDSPVRECLIRWGDTIPFGSFAHYHMWSTQATETSRNSSPDLDNTFRDATLTYGNFRVIYNAGFRDKGSPFHGGSGDFAVTVPRDQFLLGSDDRVFGSTGNGGSEDSGMRGDVSAWIAEQMRVPSLHSHYVRLYRNGSQVREVLYDLQQPNRSYAQDWYGGNDDGDNLYKIAVWFEFADNNSSFAATGATMQRFLSGGRHKLARYRWNWQLRPSGVTANDYVNIFNLADAINNSADRVTGLMNIADMEQWMRAFAYERLIGNWDSWTLNVGQNMYLYSRRGNKSFLLPWDIDFVLGLGNGATDAATGGGQDPSMNSIFNVPTYRRMMFRAYEEAIKGLMQPAKYQPQVDGRRLILQRNGLNLATPAGIATYLNSRRNSLQSQLNAVNTPNFTITSNGGADFSTASPTAPIQGTAPISVATIEVNGVPMPVTWSSVTAWRIEVPFAAANNVLKIVGRDLRGAAVPGAEATVNVTFTGTLPRAQDWVVINELMYSAPVDGGEFVELYNRHTTASFDLSGLQLSGIDFTFPPGSILGPNRYFVLAENRNIFAAQYGGNIPVLGEYSGRLDNNGETLRLIRPADGNEPEELFDYVRYERALPWPVAADGQGSSLQLIDPSQDNSRPGNWAVVAPSEANRATPGRANGPSATLTPFPSLWVNELAPNNQSGIADNRGEREPWIELFNSSGSAVDLSGLSLSDDLENLAKWSFPAGTTLGPRQFLVVWADGEPAETAGSSLHTNFRLNPTSGVVALSQNQIGGPVVLHHARYSVNAADRGVGLVPDGDLRAERPIVTLTPGAANNPTFPSVPVFINEWMASNRSVLLDPVDNDFEDWFELYNDGATPVDLSGFYLSDTLANPTRFRIPNGIIIGPKSRRLVWADDETNQNAPGRDLHANFRLPAASGAIALFSPGGDLVDTVNFVDQEANVSEGRFPDGAPAPFLAFASPTPGQPNSAQNANRPPRIAPIADQTHPESSTIAFRISASDPDPGQTVSLSMAGAPAGATLDPATGDFRWVLREEDGPSVYRIAVTATDNGTPVRKVSTSFVIAVLEENRSPSLDPIPDLSVDEGSLLTFFAKASDNDLPPQRLTYSLQPGAPAGAVIHPDTGEFSWTPTELDGPATHSVTVRVADDQSPPMAVTRTFQVTVREANNIPVIEPIAPQAVAEGALLSVPVIARDSDTPPMKLTFSLVGDSNGASIHSDTGLFTWTPTEAQGPRDYTFTVLVSEPGGAPSATMRFVVGVSEVNVAPALNPLADRIVRPGDVLVVTNIATDSDLPRQTLAYSAVTPLPVDAKLDVASGILVWQVPEDPIVGTFPVTIRATDDALPPASTERTFQVTVIAPMRVAINEILHRPSVANTEFIELVNYSDVNTLSLAGWRLEGYDYTFGAGVELKPGAFLCVARNVSAFRAAFGDAVPAVGNATMNLPTAGGLLRLIRPTPSGDEIVDEVVFEMNAPWPKEAVTDGASLQLIDSRSDNRRPGNWAAATGTVSNPVTSVLPMTATWRYWQAAASPGSTWSQPRFNDSAWASGGALHYVESAALPAPKTTQLTLGQTTYYFRAPFQFTGNPADAQLRISCIIDDGAVFYLNGVEVYRIGMPAGPVTGATFASRTAGDAGLEGPFDVPAPSLVTGQNVFAVEVHQVSAGSSDIVFGTSVDVLVTTQAKVTPGAMNSVQRNLPPDLPIWINEVMPNNTTGIADNFGEREPWVELHNAGEQPISLVGWSLTDEMSALDKWRFPIGTIVPARGFLMVWMDGQTAQSTSTHPHASFRLASPNGSLALARERDGVRVVVDSLAYRAVAENQSWGGSSDGNPVGRGVLATATPGVGNGSPPPPAIVVEIEGRTADEVAIRWSTALGVTYRLQTTESLTNPSWTTVSTFTGNGAPQTVLEAIRKTDVQRYYRVVVE